MVKENILIVCRNIHDIRLLSDFPFNNERFNYILASDDVRVGNIVHQYNWINTTCFIEKMESFYSVTNEVISIQEAISEWLQLLGSDRYGIPQNLLFFPRHVEGGKISQRIQDALLLIRSYDELFDVYEINQIIIIGNTKFTWENDVLIQTAKARGISVQKRETLKQKVVNVIKGKLLWIAVLAFYEMRFLKNFITARRSSYKSTKIVNKEDEIIFQLCSSAAKHVESNIPIMKAIQQRGIFVPKALCWYAPEGAVKIRKQGMEALDLENFLSWNIFWDTWMRLWYFALNLRKKKAEFIHLSTLSYNSVSLGTILWPSVLYLTFKDLGEHYRFKTAIENYFQKHNFLSMSLWSSASLPIPKITLEQLKVSGKRVMLFEYRLGPVIEYPYNPDFSYLDLYLVTGEIQKINVLKNKVPPNIIEIVGQGRYEHIEDFRKRFSYHHSLKHLGISDRYDFYILYDSSLSLRGFISVQERSKVLNSLCEFAQENASVALIMKPPPNISYYEIKMLKDELAYYALKNLFILDHKSLPYHALNVADILITKYSTLGLEAMLFEKPALCLILDSEKRWEIYEGGVEYLYSCKDMRLKLNQLVDHTFYKNWKEHQVLRSQAFLSRYFFKSNHTPSENSAIAIENRILSFHRNSHQNI